jgi:hypothetical protein
VIGIVGRGATLAIAPQMGLQAAQSIEQLNLCEVALFVRQEDRVALAIDDPALTASGRLDDLRAALAGLTADMTVDRFVWSLKSRLGLELMRAGVATSYLIDDRLAARARAELANLLPDNRSVHLEHLAYFAASPERMENLLGDIRPLDEPLLEFRFGDVESLVNDCLMNVAQVGEVSRGDRRYRVLHVALRDRLAVQALLNVTSRASAIAHWSTIAG